MIIDEMKFHRKQVIEHAIAEASLEEYKEIIKKRCIEGYVQGFESVSIVLKSNPFLRDYILEALEDWAKSERLSLEPSSSNSTAIIARWEDFEEEWEEEENGLQ